MAQPSIIVFSAEDVEYVPMLSDANTFTNDNTFDGGDVIIDSDTKGLKLGEDQDLLLYSDGAGILYIKPTVADTDTTVNFAGTTNSGVLTWMEDEDYFKFGDDLLIPAGENIYLRDTSAYITSLVVGEMDFITDAFRVASATPNYDFIFEINCTTHDGRWDWMEDEDYFQYWDDILMMETTNLYFRDTAIYITSSTDGHLDLTADTSVDINSTLDLAANNITMTGSIAVTGSRVTKGWFTDIEVTNMPTVGGVSIEGTFVNISGDTMTGTLNLDDDNISIVWGAGQDASITYDGTNMLINPKVVGTGYLNVQGQTLLDDKLMFTQTDGNEYIDSLDDGYLDLAATTGIRLTSPLTMVTGDLYIGNNAAADPAIVFDGDTNDGQITWKEDEDYFQFEDHVFWANPMYNDVNVGGLVLRTGGTAPGVVQILDNDGDNTGIYTVGFAVNEEGSGVMEIPHDYKEGTDLVFHVHWGANDAPSGTDNVRWQVTYSISRDSNTFPDSTAVAADDVAYDTQYEWLRTDVATITGSTGGVDGGNIKIGDQFHFSIKRIAAVVDAFGGEALVASIGFHYQTDTFGSRQIGTK